MLVAKVVVTGWVAGGPLRSVREGDLWEDIARIQYPSLGEGAEGVSLGAVHMEGVQVRVQVECGREEVNDGEKDGERQNEEATRNGRSNAHHG